MLYPSTLGVERLKRVTYKQLFPLIGKAHSTWKKAKKNLAMTEVRWAIGVDYAQKSFLNRSEMSFNRFFTLFKSLDRTIKPAW